MPGKKYPAHAANPGRNAFRSCFLALIVLFALAACQTFPRFAVERLPQYEKLFYHSDGWIGADGAYSAALGENKYLWLFGDTLVGQVKDGRRILAGMAPNSIAIQSGNDPRAASIVFFPDGDFEPFLKPEEDLGWFWPYHAVRNAEGLFFFLLQLERADLPPPFGFRLVSTWLGCVNNPEDPPKRWSFFHRKIPFGNAQRQFGSFILTEGDYGYIYGAVAEPMKNGFAWHMVLARAPLEKLADFSSWLFFRDGEWIKDVERAGRICENVASEFSVSFQPALKKYILVYTERGFSERAHSVVMRLSPNLHGPWSDPIPVYQCPEARQDPRICCYGAKGHPEIARSPAELILTYVANSCAGDLKVLQDADLYRPRFVRIFFGDPKKE